MPSDRTLTALNDSYDIADVLSSIGVKSTEVTELDGTLWDAATRLASWRTSRFIEVPTDATRTMVWSRLCERERLEHVHPLEGLPR